MKILVIGGGLIGITTAYFLRGRGHEVTVIERQAGPGRETSFANGALLHPSMPEPWNAPGCGRAVLRSLGRSDAALQLRLSALPGLLGWGRQFLQNSAPCRFERNTLSNLRLAQYSLRTMHVLLQQTRIEYGRVAGGSLRVFRAQDAFDRAVDTANRRLTDGLAFRRLSAQETIDLEPALAPIAPQLFGAIHYQTDEIGDAYRFCEALTEEAHRNGVHFHFDTEASALESGSDGIAAVRAGERRFVADRYVIAAGSYSRLLLRAFGIRLPVQPAKGYSLSANNAADRTPLRLPVIDDQLHAAVVPLPGLLRVAGTAEFAGYNRTVQPMRIRNLVKLLKQILPQAPLDLETAKPWCGLRPMSVDGVPVIGPTPVENLWINTGHGHLGWTTAVGSAQLMTDLICGVRPAIDPAPFSLSRFV